VSTVTLVNVPSLVVTVIPAEGSASAAPLAGLIWIGDGGVVVVVLALPAALDLAAAPAWMLWCPLLEHAEASRASTVAATMPTDRLGSFLRPYRRRIVICS
jgi:hypothetical protein